MKRTFLIVMVFFRACFVFSQDQDLDSLLSFDLEELMNVKVVSATKTPKEIKNAPSTIISLTGKEIEEMGARTLSDVLKMMTGIQILNRRNGRDMVWIRGITTGYNTKVLLLIDGIPQREAILGEWSSDEEILLSNIDHIEIIRGPGSALYGGNAYAGIISVFTKEDTDKASISIRGGSFDTRQFEFYLGKALSDSKIITAGNFLETNGHQMARDRKGYETNHNDHVDAKNFHGKFIHKSFRLALNYNDFVTDYPLYKTGEDKQQYYKITNGFTDFTIDKGKITMKPQIYVNYATRFFDFKIKDDTGNLTGAQESHLKSIIGGFDGQVTYDMSKWNTLVSGINLEGKRANENYEEVTLEYSNSDFAEYIDDNGDTIEVPLVNDHYYYSWLDKEVSPASRPGKIKTYNYGAYLQDEMRFIDDRLNLTLGLRFDKYEGFDAELSPRAGLVVNVIRDLTVKILGGRAFKPPTYRQKYMVRIDGKSPGNPNVGPERIITFESEIAYHFKNMIRARLNYFNNTLSDFIESVNYAAYSNSNDKRKISGFEIGLNTLHSFDFNFLTSLSLISNYSFLDAYDEIDSKKVIVPSIAKQSGNVGVKLKNKWVTFYSGLNCIGKRNSSETYHSGVKVDEYRVRYNKDPYVIWDTNLGINKFFNLPLKFNLSVHNLLDRKHYNPTYDPDSYYDYTKERRNIAFTITAEL